MTTYYWCRGQDDNIGDVVLRRRLLRTLCRAGEVTALLGRASPGFVEATTLDLPVSVELSEQRWLLQAYRNLYRPGWALALNPGELPADRRQAVTHCVLIPLLAAARWGGRRRTLRVGAGVRSTRRTMYGVPIRTAARLTDLVAWRDPGSAAVLGGAAVPDWAFDEQLDPTAPASLARTTLAVTMRGDRPWPSADWLGAVRGFAHELQQRPTVFVQVRRDGERARALAAALDARLVEWLPGTSHLEQERVVRRLMKSSSHVISDRLHALVMATSEGAGIIAPVPGVADKIQQNLAHLGFGALIRDVSSDDERRVRAFLSHAVELLPTTSEAAAHAREAVRAADKRVLEYLTS